MLARRRDVVDEYVEDGRAVVYTTGGTVVLLSELASVAWSVLSDRWTTVAVVSERLVEQFGSPEPGADPLQMTADALRTLADRELVELDDRATESVDVAAAP